MALDNDFLLVAYQEYLNEEEDWPNYRKCEAFRPYKGNWPKALPLLIRECGRLMPVYNRKTGYFDFHPFNMPDTIIKNVQLIGTIVGLKIRVKYMEIKLCDGTGTMTVLHKVVRYKDELRRREAIDLKYKIPPEDLPRYERLMRQNLVPNARFRSIQRRIRFQKTHAMWWKECNQGMLGKRLEIGSYVNVHGFCNIRRDKLRDKSKPGTFWDHKKIPSMIFFTYSLQSVTEAKYNETLQNWVNGIIKQKYTAD